MKTLPGVLLKIDPPTPHNGSAKALLEYVMVKGRHKDQTATKLASLELFNLKAEAILKTFDALSLIYPEHNTTRVIIISIQRGTVYGPKLWRLFWTRTCHHVNRFARYADDPKGLENVDVNQLACALPVHNNTDEQHAQAALSMVHPHTKRRIIINNGREIEAWQYAIQQAQAELSLVPDPRMPCYRLEQGGLVHTNPKKKDEMQLSPKQAAMEALTRQPCTERLLKRLLRDPKAPNRFRPPASFGSREKLDQFLREHEAGWAAHRAGAVVTMRGGITQARSLGNDWQLPAMRDVFGPDISSLGMDLAEQKQRAKNRQHPQNRYTAAELETLKRPLAETREILRTFAQAQGFQAIEIQAVGIDNRKRRIGRFNGEELASEGTVKKLRELETSGYTLLGRPEYREYLTIPMGHVNKFDLAWMEGIGLEPAVVIELGPDINDVIFMIDARRMLTCQFSSARSVAATLAELYRGDLEIVPTSAISLPGFVSMHGPKPHLAKVVCCSPKANDKMYEIVTEYRKQQTVIEREILAGWIPEAARRLSLVPPRRDPLAELYREHAKELDRVQANLTSVTDIERAHSLAEVDSRVAGRLLLAGVSVAQTIEIVAAGVLLTRGASHEINWTEYAQKCVDQALAQFAGLEPDDTFLAWNRAAQLRAESAAENAVEVIEEALDPIAIEPRTISERQPRIPSQPPPEIRRKPQPQPCPSATPTPIPAAIANDLEEEDSRRLDRKAARAGFHKYRHRMAEDAKQWERYEKLIQECSELDAGIFAEIWADLKDQQHFEEMKEWMTKPECPEPDWLPEARAAVLGAARGR